MQLSKKLLANISQDFSDYNFAAGDIFKWSPTTKTITYRLAEKNSAWLILHEIAHAELSHNNYNADINLLRYESAAWDYAKRNLQNKYSINICDNFVQDCLDTYRDWLHSRSICPACKQTGIQTKKNTYSCLNCRYSWFADKSQHCNL